jgi:hypothetical protein
MVGRRLPGVVVMVLFFIRTCQKLFEEVTYVRVCDR